MTHGAIWRKDRRARAYCLRPKSTPPIIELRGWGGAGRRTGSSSCDATVISRLHAESPRLGRRPTHFRSEERRYRFRSTYLRDIIAADHVTRRCGTPKWNGAAGGRNGVRGHCEDLARPRDTARYVAYAAATTTIRLRFDGCSTTVRLLIKGH